MEHAVILDMKSVPGGDKHKHALIIAEHLLQICGLIQIKDEPNGTRSFIVRTIPQDIPQAGIRWTEVDLVRFEGSVFGGE